MNNFTDYNTHLYTWDVNAFGPENKMAILHATTTTKVKKKKKIDLTKRPLFTHTPPPQMPEKYAEFLGGGEGVVWPPLIQGHCM